MLEQSLYEEALDIAKRITDNCETEEVCFQMLELLRKLVTLRFHLAHSLVS